MQQMKRGGAGIEEGRGGAGVEEGRGWCGVVPGDLLRNID